MSDNSPFCIDGSIGLLKSLDNTVKNLRCACNNSRKRTIFNHINHKNHYNAAMQPIFCTMHDKEMYEHLA